MNKGGRPQDTVWEHFLRVEVAGKVYARCKVCGHQQANRATRLKAHQAKCSRSHSNDNADKANDSPIQHLKKRARSPSPTPAKKQAVPVSVTQYDMSSHVVKTSTNLKATIDIEVAKLFYACNLPFSLVEHPQFVRVVQLLRPGYKPPTRKVIGDSLLDRVTDELQQDMRAALDGKVVTLVQDGWSNCHNEPIVASCLQEGSKSYFLDSHDTGSMTKSADNCKKLAQDSIRTAKEKFNCTVKSIVTDNAKNMEKMRASLKEDDTELVVYGCSAHWLNLLGQDLTPPAIIKHVTEVQKYFRNHHKPNAWLTEISNSMKPQLPGETRWKSQLVCLDSFIHNRPHYMKIVQDHEDEIDNGITRKILDFGLYRSIKDLAAQLRPVATALDVCQSDGSTIADACHTWINLLEDPALAPHQAVVEKRFKQAVQPEHLAAYKLHQGYQGRQLSTEQLEIVNNWISEKNPSFISTLIAFQAKASPFPSTYFLDSATQISPVTWWQAVRSSGVPSDFVTVAVQLLSAPASSASIERIFSHFSHIHTKIRNRLGNDKTSKLVFCYRMLRGDHDLDY